MGRDRSISPSEYLLNHIGREDRRHTLLWAFALTLISGMLIVVGRRPEAISFWTWENGTASAVAVLFLALVWIDPAANHILGRFMARGVPSDNQPTGVAHWLSLFQATPLSPTAVALSAFKAGAFFGAAVTLWTTDLPSILRGLAAVASAIFVVMAIGELVPLFGPLARRFLLRVASGLYLGLVRKSKPGNEFYQANEYAIREIRSHYPPWPSHVSEAAEDGLRMSTGFIYHFAPWLRAIPRLGVLVAGSPFLLGFITLVRSEWTDDPHAVVAMVELIIGFAMVARLAGYLLLDNGRHLLDELMHETIEGRVSEKDIAWYVQMITVHQKSPILNIHSIYQFRKPASDG